jgi:hypothetical protein
VQHDFDDIFHVLIPNAKRPEEGPPHLLRRYRRPNMKLNATSNPNLRLLSSS